MNLADLAGQSLMLRVAGPVVTPELLDALARTRANGVVLFGDNVRTAAGLYLFVGTLQMEAARLGLPPLLIAIDQEGGTVGRLPAPFTTVPSQMAQAATGDPDAAYRCARLTGQQLRAVGINTNFAPVLDVNCQPANPVIGTRAFGQDPELVAEFGLAALRGYREAGIIATAKHFPGHGDTAVDSHLGLPVLQLTREQLRRRELVPFLAAVRAGVPAVMTAHIVLTAFDDHPATLSRAIVTDLLRGELGYDGVVFTDALKMGAISGCYEPAEAACLAKAAGADVVLPLGTLEEQVVVAQALREAITSGELAPGQFEATARRLERLRAAYQVTSALPPFAEPDPALEASALAIARRGTTVIHGQDRLPLVSTTRLALIDCLLARWSLVEEAVERAGLLRARLEAAFPRLTGIAVGPEPTDVEVERALALASESEVVLLVTRHAFLVEHQAQLARAVAGLGVPLIHAAVRGPYDAAVVPASMATILTYGDPPVSLQALVDVLAGEAWAAGALPVRVMSDE